MWIRKQRRKVSSSKETDQQACDRRLKQNFTVGMITLVSAWVYYSAKLGGSVNDTTIIRHPDWKLPPTKPPALKAFMEFHKRSKELSEMARRKELLFRTNALPGPSLLRTAEVKQLRSTMVAIANQTTDGLVMRSVSQSLGSFRPLFYFLFANCG